MNSTPPTNASAGSSPGRRSSRTGPVPWSQYAFDRSEKQKLGKRSREWTAVGNTEEECIGEMARCLREISEGRAPK